jgi:hypothetical protein
MLAYRSTTWPCCIRRRDATPRPSRSKSAAGRSATKALGSDHPEVSAFTRPRRGCGGLVPPTHFNSPQLLRHRAPRPQARHRSLAQRRYLRCSPPETYPGRAELVFEPCAPPSAALVRWDLLPPRTLRRSPLHGSINQCGLVRVSVAAMIRAALANPDATTSAGAEKPFGAPTFLVGEPTSRGACRSNSRDGGAPVAGCRLTYGRTGNLTRTGKFMLCSQNESPLASP